MTVTIPHLHQIMGFVHVIGWKHTACRSMTFTTHTRGRINHNIVLGQRQLVTPAGTVTGLTTNVEFQSTTCGARTSGLLSRGKTRVVAGDAVRQLLGRKPIPFPNPVVITGVLYTTF